jgi:hypothetical protein
MAWTFAKHHQQYQYQYQQYMAARMAGIRWLVESWWYYWWVVVEDRFENSGDNSDDDDDDDADAGSVGFVVVALVQAPLLLETEIVFVCVDADAEVDERSHWKMMEAAPWWVGCCWFLNFLLPLYSHGRNGSSQLTTNITHQRIRRRISYVEGKAALYITVPYIRRIYVRDPSPIFWRRVFGHHE